MVMFRGMPTTAVVLLLKNERGKLEVVHPSTSPSLLSCRLRSDHRRVQGIAEELPAHARSKSSRVALLSSPTVLPKQKRNITTVGPEKLRRTSGPWNPRSWPNQIDTEAWLICHVGPAMLKGASPNGWNKMPILHFDFGFTTVVYTCSQHPSVQQKQSHTRIREYIYIYDYIHIYLLISMYVCIYMLFGYHNYAQL